MEVGKTLYVHKREDWRKWLSENYSTAPDIWLIFYKKNSGKPRLPYDEAVEEALCYGWIDSILKPGNEVYYYQRFTPRRKKSILSETNKVRVYRMIEEGKMTPAGLESIKHHLQASDDANTDKLKEYVIPDDILRELQADPAVWTNFQQFPENYKKIRAFFIDTARKHPEVFTRRLKYFLKMTALNKMYGTIRK
ncbi:MAG: YdeI/OmpD-associated family protein [Bacteroidetes bacterium]|nr:YdeI/OmpD-associated family protein [Bacteroidota bacterium]